jgi:hypothetical protein
VGGGVLLWHVSHKRNIVCCVDIEFWTSIKRMLEFLVF